VCGPILPLPRVFRVQCLIEHRRNIAFFSEQQNCEEIPYILSNLTEKTVDGKKDAVLCHLTMKACEGSRGLAPQTPNP
jgi:hypothetical protein